MTAGWTLLLQLQFPIIHNVLCFLLFLCLRAGSVRLGIIFPYGRCREDGEQCVHLRVDHVHVVRKRHDVVVCHFLSEDDLLEYGPRCLAVWLHVLLEKLIYHYVVLKSAERRHQLVGRYKDSLVVLLPDKVPCRLLHLCCLFLRVGVHVYLYLIWLHDYSGIGGTPAGGPAAAPMVLPPLRPWMKLNAPTSLSWFCSTHPKMSPAIPLICWNVVGGTTSKSGMASMSFMKKSYSFSALSMSFPHALMQLAFSAILDVGTIMLTSISLLPNIILNDERGAKSSAPHGYLLVAGVTAARLRCAVAADAEEIAASDCRVQASLLVERIGGCQSISV